MEKSDNIFLIEDLQFTFMRVVSRFQEDKINYKRIPIKTVINIFNFWEEFELADKKYFKSKIEDYLNELNCIEKISLNLLMQLYELHLTAVFVILEKKYKFILATGYIAPLIFYSPILIFGIIANQNLYTLIIYLLLLIYTFLRQNKYQKIGKLFGKIY